jgi:hypothetical protein
MPPCPPLLLDVPALRNVCSFLSEISHCKQSRTWFCARSWLKSPPLPKLVGIYCQLGLPLSHYLFKPSMPLFPPDIFSTSELRYGWITLLIIGYFYASSTCGSCPTSYSCPTFITLSSWWDARGTTFFKCLSGFRCLCQLLPYLVLFKIIYAFAESIGLERCLATLDIPVPIW